MEVFLIVIALMSSPLFAQEAAKEKDHQAKDEATAKRAEDAKPFVWPQSWKVWQRGNDDPAENRNLGPYMTAILYGGLRNTVKEDGTDIDLFYYAVLATDERMAPEAAPRYCIKDIDNGISPPTAAARLDVQVARKPNGRPDAGTVIRAGIRLGKIPPKGKFVHQGVTIIVPCLQVNLPLGRMIPKQVIRWSVTVEDGKVTSNDVNITEPGNDLRLRQASQDLTPNAGFDPRMRNSPRFPTPPDSVLRMLGEKK